MKLENYIKLISNKIDTKYLNCSTYISTENIIPNFGGVCNASNIPYGKCNSFLKGDTLLSNIRPYFRKVWFATFDGGCSADVLVIRPSKDINPKYLYYFLANDNFINYYNASCKGTKMPRGNKEALLDWNIKLPHLSIQQHIVNTLR